MAMKKPKTETLEMRQLFETYYAMGNERSFRKLIEVSGISMSSAKRYSSAFNWAKRIEQRDIENSKTIEKRTNEFVVNSKAMYRETIKKLTDQFVRDVDEGKIKINNIADFEKIVKLDLDLMGVGADAHLVDNIATLTETLRSSGWDKVPDPDEED